MTKFLLATFCAAVVAGCGSNTCGGGQACVQSTGGDACRNTCSPDAGNPCPTGQACTRTSACCAGTACAAVLVNVCCPTSGC